MRGYKNEVYFMPHNIASFPAMAKRFQLADFNDRLDDICGIYIRLIQS
jgi:hypothetical protein